MKKKQFRLIIALIMLAFLSIQFVQGLTTIEADEVKVDLQITNAYYCDADFDGEEDDVVLHFETNITFLENKYLVKFYLEIDLILPSGMQFSYLYEIYTTRTFLNFTMFFYNHALEPGDYIGIVTLHLSDDGEFISGTEQIIFDPPGKTDDTDPPATELIVE
ncbi:MAG: hypothetical protein K9W46_04710 [Candidatus Heimdallarchaeum endolithica]|uniref:Uncharacterized protein n=1 Tax=Candidatus Heimdallarchaeum endolithica TaxID=2876572 RepID=A0A9Y1BT64_9ARCH|nr:MAG: hypothetical protein K9W46_04710 [Candidatus Heimdallarchaeum endolithica]